MYTSRLPKSTSVRRPTDGGSTSFAGLHRPSNIPVTVKKANLFTPHNKRPTHGAASTAGKSFMSGLATEKKFQRPMPDKEQQVKMFDTLVEFIKEMGPDMPVPEAKKFFSSVSTSESSRLFEFLIRFIIPDFKIVRLEKDVPEALEILGYPYIRSVTKSALVSVTTRQAATGLLKIFHWLVGHIRQMDSNEDEDGDLDEIAQTYECVFSQPERDQEAAQEVFERIYPHVDVEMRLVEQRQLEGVLQSLREEEEDQNRLLNMTKALEEDIPNMRTYRDNLKEYYETKLSEQIEIGQQISKLDFQNEEKERRPERLESAIQNHEVVEDDAIRNLNALQRLETDKNHWDTKTKENEIELGHVVKRYHTGLSKCSRAIDETVVAMKKLLQNLEAYAHIDSKQLAERAQAIRDWVWKLEQLDHSDLEQVRKYDREVDLFFQMMEGTSPTLVSELTDLLLDKKDQVQNLETSNANRNEKKSVLDESIKRLQREEKADNIHFAEQISRGEAQAEELTRHLLRVKEDGKRRSEELSVAHTENKKKLEQDQLNEQNFEQLIKGHLTALCEGNRQKIVRIVDLRRNDAEQFDKALIIDQENNKLLKGFAERLKRRAIV